MRSRSTAAFITPPLKSTCVGHARPLGPRRTADVAAAATGCRRNFARCRVIAASAAYGRPSSWKPTRRWRAGIASLATRGRNPSSSTARRSSAVTSVRIEPPISLLPRPSSVTGCDAERRIAEERFLREPRLVPQPVQLPRVDLVALLLEAHLQHAREGEVHVVAAEQDVLADRHPLEPQLAALLGHGDQAEVGRAAADVAHEHEIADAHAAPPAIALLRDPRVERGLRLLEQRHVPEAGLLGGAHRQDPRLLVERRRHRQQHVLVFEAAA